MLNDNRGMNRNGDSGVRFIFKPIELCSKKRESGEEFTNVEDRFCNVFHSYVHNFLTRRSFKSGDEVNFRDEFNIIKDRKYPISEFAKPIFEYEQTDIQSLSITVELDGAILASSLCKEDLIKYMADILEPVFVEAHKMIGDIVYTNDVLNSI